MAVLQPSLARTLVLGLGNPLMGDDGLGLTALERLATRWVVPPEVQLLDGGTGGLQLLPPIEDADRLIFLDVIEAGEEPGRLVLLERDELPRFFAHKISPHEIALRDVLALAELRGRLPAHLVAIGLQPARVTMGPGLSPEVEPTPKRRSAPTPAPSGFSRYFLIFPGKAAGGMLSVMKTKKPTCCTTYPTSYGCPPC